MRQGQQNRRGRGRSNNGSSNNHSNNNSSNNSNNNNSSNGRKPQNPLSRNYESSGPDVKIRGTAAQIAEKYLTLARDASSSGDIVMAENYLQHAEHYNRIIMAAQVQAATQHPNGGDYGMGMNGHHNHRMQADGITNFGMMRDEPQPMIEQPRQQYQAQPQHQPQPQPPQQQTPLPGMEPQPEVATAAPAAVASTDTPAADAGEQAASRAAPDADGRRRRRRYPAGSTAASRAAAAAASAEPAANGHNGTGNGLDNEGRPSDEALAN